LQQKNVESNKRVLSALQVTVRKALIDHHLPIVATLQPLTNGNMSSPMIAETVESSGPIPAESLERALSKKVINTLLSIHYSNRHLLSHHLHPYHTAKTRISKMRSSKMGIPHLLVSLAD
jgi:hypothetical protein